ncbi:hypothetical protein H2203_008138 [Taxawa tesnikishii (nom. ined.)]|nr:hypothetical protein H2203_008138 [Dothideales sp. JES 119]
MDHTVRVTLVSTLAAKPPFGLWQHTSPGLSDSPWMPAYAPYGEPWPATFQYHSTAAAADGRGRRKTLDSYVIDPVPGQKPLEQDAGRKKRRTARRGKKGTDTKK